MLTGCNAVRRERKIRNLHDVAMGTDYQVADILASQHDCKQRRGSQLPVNLKTCP
ncbi:hypothetical protein [Escherichia coli]|uniref:hypothetical protein n=1 Tax=Escherichia coli TaxID=562 RepID=UPI001D7120FA|nr:hypothetical protein [Escherichia coli]EER5674511.1 hypothetical protein [Escherichia coli]